MRAPLNGVLGARYMGAPTELVITDADKAPTEALYPLYGFTAASDRATMEVFINDGVDPAKVGLCWDAVGCASASDCRSVWAMDPQLDCFNPDDDAKEYCRGLPKVKPSPATHAILTDLKAGESVFQTLLLTKTVVQRSTTTVSCTILASKHSLSRFFPRL